MRSRVVAAGCMVLLGGCADAEPVTQLPDPPLDSTDWFTIWTAVVLMLLVWAALVVHRLVRRPASSRIRLIAGSVFAIGAVVALLPIGDALVRLGRLVSIVGWERCRAVAPAERPAQILQIECVPGSGHGLLWFSAGYVAALSLLLAALCAMSAAVVLRSPARPWLPTALAWIAVAGLSALAISAIGNDTSASEWLALGASIVAALAAGVSCSVLVMRRPVPVDIGAAGSANVAADRPE